MVASIGVVTSPAQGASYYERDGYYAKDDSAHKEASRWAGKGVEGLGTRGVGQEGLFAGLSRQQGGGHPPWLAG